MRSMPALVSVIIPCYNAEPRLKRTLEGVIQQTHPNLQIIFVDNNSKDGSLEIARAMQRESRAEFTILECKRQGAGYARAMGFENARGDYIQWLDSDDEIDVRKIEHQVAALEADPSADVASGTWIWRIHQEDGGPILDFPHKPLEHKDMVRQFVLDDWQPPTSYLVRRRLADKLHAMDGWHIGARAGDDRQYFGYAAILGAGFVPVPDAVTVYNLWSRNQLTHSVPTPERSKAIKEMMDNFRRLLAEQPPERNTEFAREFLSLPEDRFALSPKADAVAAGEGPLSNIVRAMREFETWEQCYMIFNLEANPLEPLTLVILRRFWRVSIREEPAGAFDPLRVFQRFHALLGLPPPVSVPRSVVPYEKLDSYPPASPVLIDYRETVLRHLLDLRREGVLVPFVEEQK